MAFSKFKKKLINHWRIKTNRFRSFPDFIVIGAQKGGTSSLFFYLNQHPNISLSIKKEIHFFNLNFHKGIHWYRSYFPFKKNAQTTGEATPAYLFHPDVPERIHKVLPKTKFIVLLRNPIDRAYSAFKMNVRLGLETLQDFELAIERELKLSTFDEHRGNNYSFERHNYFYLERGLYANQLNLWFNYFSRDQFLILNSEQFLQNPKEILAEVYEFLGVKKHFPQDFSIINRGSENSVSTSTRENLELYFVQENKVLYELINKDLNWE